MKLRIQILLALLIILKVVLGSIFVGQVGLGPLSAEADAIASELPKDPEVTAREDKKVKSEEKTDLNFFIMKQKEKKEKIISEKKAELLAIQADINKKIAILTKLRDEIRAEVARKKTAEEQKIKHLIKVYSAMKPQSAAGLIEKLDIKLAIELLSKMKGDAVGKILSFVDTEKAAKISEGFVN